MQRLLRLVARVAPTDSTCCVLCESGTGKELVARLAPTSLASRAGPVLPVTSERGPCADGERVFGHRSGRVHGRERHGAARAWMQADHGTLFLTRFVDMPLRPCQVLRARRETTDGCAAAARTRPARACASWDATHRDLPKMVSEGRFREDSSFA